jgi:hypothetical protein
MQSHRLDLVDRLTQDPQEHPTDPTKLPTANQHAQHPRGANVWLLHQAPRGQTGDSLPTTPRNPDEPDSFPQPPGDPQPDQPDRLPEPRIPEEAPPRNPPERIQDALPTAA